LEQKFDDAEKGNKELMLNLERMRAANEALQVAVSDLTEQV
jgi:hypothetical protein